MLRCAFTNFDVEEDRLVHGPRAVEVVGAQSYDVVNDFATRDDAYELFVYGDAYPRRTHFIPHTDALAVHEVPSSRLLDKTDDRLIGFYQREG